MSLYFVSDAVARPLVVADSLTHRPLANASVFDRKGHFMARSGTDGTVASITAGACPVTVRLLGFKEAVVSSASVDTVFLVGSFTNLPEVVVESRDNRVLHMLAYVREYSTMSTYTDTVSMFREKMVDFMLPSDGSKNFKGWRYPRVLNSRSYYRFTDKAGLDSVSDRYNNHFTWSDWIGILPPFHIPSALAIAAEGVDTLSGRYDTVERWTRTGDRVSIDINVLADSAARRWTPGLSSFIGNDEIDFDQFRLRLNYANIISDIISPLDLTGYSCTIESRGRGRGMFRFTRQNWPFFVTTYTEVYIVDKEYITLREARKWDSRKFSSDDIAFFYPPEAPDLQPSIISLIDRVDRINADSVRLALPPDTHLLGARKVKRGLGYRALQLIKIATGISQVRMNRQQNKRWREFRRKQLTTNEHYDSISRTHSPDSITP